MTTPSKSGPSQWLRSLGLGSRELRSWAMYDWANSAFTTTVMAAMLPIYFHDVAAADLPENLRTAYWGYASAAGLAIAAVFAPMLGAMADLSNAKKKFLAGFMLLGVVSTAILFFVYKGDWQLAAVMFLLGSMGFYGGNVFYDAMLPSLARDEEVDRVSSAGFAIGYVGGGLLLALNLAWVLNPALFGFADKGVAVRASFLSVAVWWLVFSLPILKNVPEAKATAPRPPGNLWTLGFARSLDTFREIRRYREVLLFLIAFWFYSDGVGTIIKMATIFGREIGIGSTHLIGALLLVQFLGIPATFAFGSLAGRLGTRATIQVSLAVYTGICILGYFMQEAWHFWVLAVLVATVQGASQALSRSLYASIVPRDRAAEFFSFISISSRFAGVMGPLLFGVVAQFGGGSRLSILFLIAFFVIGMTLLQRVDLDKARRVAQGS